MALDLSKLSPQAISKRPINPLEIWNQLDRAVGKEYLRPIQERVLEGWFSQREDADTIIKMNTGTGKTLVGLLVLQACLHEAPGPALYLCPDKYLVSQVVEQAKQFGVRCVTFEGESRPIPPDFLNGEAILVATVKKLFNGKSVFGVEGSPTPPVSVNYVVLDDAHTCVEQIRSQFTITLGNDHAAYERLIKLFGQTLAQQKPGTFAEIQGGEFNKFMAVPYWTWLDSQSEVVRILSEYRDDEPLRFVWPLLKDLLPICDCVFSGSQLQIVPKVIRPQLLTSFALAKRRIYLSATLLDDSQLARDLGVSAAAIEKQIKPNELEDLGERLILIPSDVHESLNTEWAVGLFALNVKMNRVVLVPTKRESARWEEAGAKRVLAENIAEALEGLRKLKGAFLALVSKYDGVDLPDETCRLLAIDSLPRAATLYDWYLQSALAGTPSVNAKIAQRIEQGLGRATRGKSDYCVILITGNDLVSFVRNNQNRKHLSAGSRAQIDLGLRITREINRLSTEDKYSQSLVEEINRCLERADVWKAFYRSFIEESRKNLNGQVQHNVDLVTATTERAAADLFLKRKYEEAAGRIQTLLDGSGLTEREKGWFMQLAASYLYGKDKSKALSMQKKAYELNSFLFVPPDGTTYHRMAASSESQSIVALRHLLSHANINDFVLDSHSVCDHLAFGIESELFEQALEKAATIIGISSSRPEKITGRGPDCLWGGDNDQFLVIEAKSEVDLDRTEIHKSETEQLTHSCEWFRQEYVGKDRMKALLIHPATKLAREAVFPPTGRVVTAGVLENFVLSIRNYVSAVAGLSGANRTEREIRSRLEANSLLFDRCFASAEKTSTRRT
jgi:DEAD/DEAH box helicase